MLLGPPLCWIDNLIRRIITCESSGTLISSDQLPVLLVFTTLLRQNTEIDVYHSDRNLRSCIEFQSMTLNCVPSMYGVGPTKVITVNRAADL